MSRAARRTRRNYGSWQERREMLVRWLLEGPYANVPAVKRIIQKYQDATSADEYNALEPKLKKLWNKLEGHEPTEEPEPAGAEPSVQDINAALIAGTLGIGESGRVRPLPGATPRPTTAPEGLDVARRVEERRRRRQPAPEPQAPEAPPHDLVWSGLLDALLRKLDEWNYTSANERIHIGRQLALGGEGVAGRYVTRQTGGRIPIEAFRLNDGTGARIGTVYVATAPGDNRTWVFSDWDFVRAALNAPGGVDAPRERAPGVPVTAIDPYTQEQTPLIWYGPLEQLQLIFTHYEAASQDPETGSHERLLLDIGAGNINYTPIDSGVRRVGFIRWSDGLGETTVGVYSRNVVLRAILLRAPGGVDAPRERVDRLYNLIEGTAPADAGAAPAGLPTHYLIVKGDEEQAIDAAATHGLHVLYAVQNDEREQARIETQVWVVTPDASVLVHWMGEGRGAPFPPGSLLWYCDVNEHLLDRYRALIAARWPEARDTAVQPLLHPTLAPENDPSLQAWTIGYDLDGGGYSFEYADPAITAELEHTGMTWHSRMLQWESPDLDYILGGDVVPRRRRADLLLVIPGAGGAAWPEEFVVDTDLYTKLNEGMMYASDHECAWCGPGTDNEASRATCTRCGGEGRVDSPGGAWAIYERSEAPEEEEEEEEEEEDIATAITDCISGMANALWWTAWADAMDEAGRGRELSGHDVADIAPPTPQRAKALGEALFDKIDTINATHAQRRAERHYVLAEWARLVREDGVGGSHIVDFGYYLAMEALGHGVGWADSHAPHQLEVPDIEVHLDDPDDPSTLHASGLEGYGV